MVRAKPSNGAGYKMLHRVRGQIAHAGVHGKAKNCVVEQRPNKQARNAVRNAKRHERAKLLHMVLNIFMGAYVLTFYFSRSRTVSVVTTRLS